MYLRVPGHAHADAALSRRISENRTLAKAVPFAKSSDFGGRVEAALATIWNAAKKIRLHRNKRVAHFDLQVGLKLQPLPAIQLAAFGAITESIERYLNLFFVEFEQTTMAFKMLSAHEITNRVEVTARKARAYDWLEQNKTIPHGEWRRLWRKEKSK